MDYLLNLLQAGWLSLLDYLAAHVLLCLVPAFVIAGFMSALIPKEFITKYLGPKSSPWISYPVSAIGGFILAVCSCTILPLFAGIWKRGAGLGPAITFLFVGPAINILAISYTGAAIGYDIAGARLILSIVFGILIGLLMAWIFRKEEQTRQIENSALFVGESKIKKAVWVVFLILLFILLVGTLQIDLLSNTVFQVTLPFKLSNGMIAFLDTAQISIQGLVLILLLIMIAFAAWKGFNKILEGFNTWTYIALGLIGITVLSAAPSVLEGSLEIHLNGRFFGELILLVLLFFAARRYFTRHDLQTWLFETWRFVKQIFPLLIVGVFVAGMFKVLIPQQWIENLAGENTILANFIGVVFGVFMYFPTLVEVPVARMFMELGMHKGPLLAYLLSDPELSVQSILVTNKILGSKKTATYVVLVSIFSTAAGYLFGMILTLF